MAFRKDAPPNSRLFILCQKGLCEREFRETFGKYGQIEDVWIVKDKRTNEDRGIVYISFSKTSEAMLAMEDMNGRCMPGQQKPLKVVVASSKREGSTRDPREEEKLVFGDLQYVTVMRDKATGESKGFGYIRYHRPYHAALAYEQCCREIFKPRFAEPQRSRDERESKLESFYSFGTDPHSALLRGQNLRFDDSCPGHSDQCTMQMTAGYDPGMTQLTMGSTKQAVCMGMGEPDLVHDDYQPPPLPAECQHLQIVTPIGMTQDYLTKLFNLVPGLEYCDLNEATGLAYAKYATPQCTAYAREKMNGFEYPLGSPLTVLPPGGKCGHK